MKNKLRLAIISSILACGQAQATNWLMLQGTEPAGSAARAKIWGFIQPEFQYTSGSELAAGPWAGQKAVFNQIGPDNKSDSTFQLRRARLGVRGTGFPIDSRVNYFLLAEFGNNGITQLGGSGAVKLTDASVTLNHIPGARVRIGQFKTPGSEEGIQAIHVFNYVNFTNFANQQLLERFFDEDGSRPGFENDPNGSIGAFRDIGVQVFDSFRSEAWEHSYAVMVGNGNGITRGDNDDNKEIYLKWSSELIFNNSKGPRREGLKMFAWYQDGERTLDFANGVAGEQEFDRTRWGLGTTFHKGKWRASAEYFKADGMIFNGTDGAAVAGSLNNAGTTVASFNVLPEDEADGWYIDAGYKVLPNLELDLRYDMMNRGTETSAGERKFTTATIGAQYFFNKKTRLIVNYEFRDAEAPNQPGSSGANRILDEMDDRASIQLLAIF